MARQYKFNTAVNKVRKNSDNSFNSDTEISSFDDAVEAIRARKNNNYSLTEIDRANRLKYIEEGQKKARLEAIELAKNNASSSSDANTQVNAGNDRITAYNKPQSISVYGGYGTLPNPATQGMNTAANGADIDYSEINKKATENKNTWKGLIGTKSEEKSISKEESLAHANEVLAQYKDDEKVKSLLDEYVDAYDSLEIQREQGADADQKYHNVRWKQKVAKEIKKQTGLSDDEFDKVAANYIYMKHDEQAKAQKESLDDASAVKKAAMTVANVPLAAVGNYQAFMGTFKDSKDPELGTDYNSVNFMLSNLNRDTKQAVHKDIDESTLSDFQKGFSGFAYDTVTMGAESLASQGLGGAGLVSFFAGGYADALEEGEQRGLTKGQAHSYALAAGGLEYATEKIPYEGLKSILNGKAVSKEAVKGSLKPYVMAFLKQSGEEAGEEVVNGIGDTFADALINGDKSKINIAARDYMSQGLSEEEAYRKAFWDEGKEILYSAASAFASAGVSAGPALASQAIGETQSGRKLVTDNEINKSIVRDENSPNYISENVSDYDTEESYNLAQATRKAFLTASEAAAKGQRIAGKQAREIYEGVSEVYRNAAESQQNRAKAALEETNIKAELETVEQVKNASTPSEVETLRESNIESKAVNQAVEAKKEEMIAEGKATAADFDNAITPSKAVEMGKKGEEIAPEKLEQLPSEVKKAYEVGYNQKVHEVTTDVTNKDVTSIQYIKEGKKKIDSIKSVKKDSNGVVEFVTSSGDTISAADATFSDKGKYLYEGSNGILALDNTGLIQIAMDAEAASPHGISVGNLTRSLKNMYTLGATGLSFDEAIKNAGYIKQAIGEEILKQAFNEGAKAAKAKSRATNAKKGKGLIREASEDNREAYENQFADEATRDKYENEVSDTEKDFLNLLSHKIGVDIAFTNNEKSGNRGEYKPSEGKIYLNLAYGHNMFEIALHEGIGEFLAASNEKAYNQIADSVLNAYAATNADALAKRIQKYQEAYSNDTYGNTEKGASRELFNDALAEIFSSEANMKQMFDWLVTNEGVDSAQRVKKTLVDYFKDLINLIKDIRRNGGLSKMAASRLRLSEEQANQYAKMILDAMDQAIANRDAGSIESHNNELRASKEVEYSVNDNGDVVDKSGNIYAVVSEKTFSKNYIKNHKREAKNIVKASLATLVSDKPYTIKSTGQQVYVGNDFAAEYVDSKDMNVFHHSKPEVKLNASVNAKEMIENAWPKDGKAPSYEPNKEYSHRIDAKRGWNYYVTGVSFKTVDGYDVFDAILNIRLDANGKDYVYDITKLNKVTSFQSESTDKRSSSPSNDIVTSGDEKSSEESVNEGPHSLVVDSEGNNLTEGQQKYFADSKVLDEKGNLLVVYHGTEEEFYEFKPVEKGGKNGRAEGYGLYFAANQEITKAYGNRQLKGYLNITKPAYSWEKTIKPAELAKLIEATCKVEAERMLDDGYESVEEALKDTWVSNTVYTYDKSMKEAYLEAAKEYIKLNSNDMDIIITIMNDNGVQSYNDAYDFYAILKDTLGFDGYITKWTNADGTEENTVYVAFDSNQFKNIDNENPTYSPDIRFSKEIDREYYNALNANDTEKMQQLVDKAAKEAGFDSPILYHGTNAFGFTEFDLDKMDDKQTIFLTSNNNIASTYSGTTKNKAVSEKFEDIDSIPNDKLADALNSVIPDDGTDRHYEYFNQNDIKALREKALNGIRDVFKSLDELLKTTEEEKALKALKRMREIQMLSSAEEILDKDSVNKDFSTMLFMATHHTETFKNNDAWNELEHSIRKAYALTHDVSKNETEFIVDNYLDGYLFDVWTPKEARADLKENVSKGNYSLYAKLGKSLVIDCEGKNWNNLSSWSKAYTAQFNKENTSIERFEDRIYLLDNNGDILRSKNENEFSKSLSDDLLHQHMLNSLDAIFAINTEHLDTTRDIVKFAKSHGYDSVIFNNIRDNGGRNFKIDYDEKADVYALFNPNNVKSADPVTFDDNGDVIPPSERFKDDTPDIRYSFSIDDDRVYNYRGVEIVKNPTDKEYAQMRKDIREQRPWIRDDEPLLRRTFDEEGNEYYWEALAGMHSMIEPAIRKHWGVRVAQNYEWWKDEDKYFWPEYYENRYSKVVMGEDSQYTDALKQTKIIEDVLSTINNQLKGHSVSMPFIEKTVDEIIKKYNANINRDDLTMELAQFIAYMTKQERVDYNQMMNYLLNVGDEVIQASQLTDPEEQRIYDELKKELSTHKINVTENERKELISKFGGSWNAAFGKLNSIGIRLSNKGSHMDGSTYAEIADKFREIAGVALDDEITAVDQLSAIIDAMDALSPSTYGWEGASNIDKAMDVAVTIIDSYYNMASSIKESNIAKGTDKGKAAIKSAIKTETTKLRAANQKYRDKLNAEFAALVEDRKKVIAEQQEFIKRQEQLERQFQGEKREFYKKKALSDKEIEKTARLQAQLQYQSIKDTETKRKNKENIVRTCMRLINWMQKPTDARHVPTFLKPALTDMIKSIDFMPASMRKGKDGTISAQKWQESMRKLQTVLSQVNSADMNSMDDSDKYNLGLVMDAEDLVVKMDELLTKYSGTADISRMTKEDLKTLSDIMNSISKAVSQMNTNFMNRRFAHVSDAATTAIDEMNELKPVSGKMNFVKSTAADFLNLDMAEPITFFEELGEASESIMQEFFDGEKIGIDIIHEAEDFFNNLGKRLGLKTKDLRAWENDLKDYSYDGKTITLTSADIMSLYCSYHREMLDEAERPFEATHHIKAGGIKGFRHRVGFKEVNKNPEVMHLTQGQLIELMDNLTEQQKEYADSVVEYMSTTLAEHGNETSNKLNGYSKFLGKYYFPLKTDTNTLATTESNNTSDQAGFRRLIFPSFTKAQLDKADNALVIQNFFDVVTEHITGMSNYCAYSMPISDAMRWYNFAETERANTENPDEYQRYTNTLKDAMTRVRGDEAKKYFETFIRDVNLDNKPSGSKASKLISQGLTGLAKAKAVGLNIRVILQQPCAITRAADVIESKYLVKGWSKMTANPNKATKYAQDKSYLCYWKSKGFSDTRVSQSMKEIITGQETLRQDIVEKTGVLAGLADDITWAAMYYAAEEKIKDTTKLDINSEEGRKAVEDLFSDIINHTQVIDSQLRKTGTMRSTDAIEKLANAFKKEPQKTYNMLHRALWEKKQAKYSGELNRIKAADAKWHKTIRVFAANAIITAIAQSLVDAWRDEDDEKYLIKMLKKLLAYDSAADVKDFIDKINEGTVTGKDVLNFLQGVYGGAGNILDNANLLSSIPYVADIDSLFKGYSVSRLDSTAILTQLKNTMNSLASTNATPYSMIYSLSQLVGYGTGIGADNALKDIRGIYNQAIGNKTGHRIEKSKTSETDYEKKANLKALDAAINAHNLQEIKAAARDIYLFKHDGYIKKGKNEDYAKKEGNEQARRLVSDYYKETYIKLVEDGKRDEARNLRLNLIYVFTELGLSTKDAEKKIDDWVK